MTSAQFALRVRLVSESGREGAGRDALRLGPATSCIPSWAGATVGWRQQEAAEPGMQRPSGWRSLGVTARLQTALSPARLKVVELPKRSSMWPCRLPAAAGGSLLSCER